ncbi:hypothetical protein J6590_058272 [Homalodisca vitripennis]|nr:hypothetical protein J6590_058272 [Homalodisca vitripennis]
MIQSVEEPRLSGPSLSSVCKGTQSARYTNLTYLGTVAPPVTKVQSKLDEAKHYETLVQKILKAKLEEFIASVDGETGESVGVNITANEDTLENCPAEQSCERAAAQQVPYAF